ncbi:MAG: hypothetical protein WC683_10240 [bacterium]
MERNQAFELLDAVCGNLPELPQVDYYGRKVQELEYSWGRGSHYAQVLCGREDTRPLAALLMRNLNEMQVWLALRLVYGEVDWASQLCKLSAYELLAAHLMDAASSVMWGRYLRSKPLRWAERRKVPIEAWRVYDLWVFALAGRVIMYARIEESHDWNWDSHSWRWYTTVTPKVVVLDHAPPVVLKPIELVGARWQGGVRYMVKKWRSGAWFQLARLKLWQNVKEIFRDQAQGEMDEVQYAVHLFEAIFGSEWPEMTELARAQRHYEVLLGERSMTL